MALSPTQKKMLTYGVPAVVVLIVFAYLRSRSSSTPSTATASGTTSPNNAAIGVDQLASFENAVQGQFGALASILQGLPAALAAATPAAGSTTVAPPVNPVPRTPSPAPSGFAGFTYIPTYSQFEADKAAGLTIEYSVAGGALQPFIAGGKQVGAAPPAGSKWYVA